MTSQTPTVDAPVTYRRACVGFSPTKTFGGVYLSSALRGLEHYGRENQRAGSVTNAEME